MKKFIVIYHAPKEAMQQTANMKPEDQAKGMELWMTWAQKCGNKLVDLGSPLMGGQQILPGGKSKAGDQTIAGYSVLRAENMDEVKSLLKDHPHLGWNAACSIEVHESMPLPGM